MLLVSQIFWIVADKTLACTLGQKEVSCANVMHDCIATESQLAVSQLKEDVLANLRT